MSAWPGDPLLRYDPPKTVPRHRILVVDDHPPMAIAFARLIQVLGHEVRITHDGTTALACLDNYQPDIVLLDIGLPGMNGYEVARRLRATERGSRVKLVALTGYGDDDDVARARGAGFDLFLVKPVSFSSLSAVLEMLSGVTPLEEH